MSRRELYPIGTHGGNVTILSVAHIAKGMDECKYLVRYHCCGAVQELSHKRFRMVLTRTHSQGAPICRRCARHNFEVRRQLALAGQPAPAPGAPWLPPYGCADVVGAWPVPPSLRVELAASAGWQP